MNATISKTFPNELLRDDESKRTRLRLQLGGFMFFYSGNPAETCSVLSWMKELGIECYRGSPGPAVQGFKSVLAKSAAKRNGKKLVWQKCDLTNTTSFQLIELEVKEDV